MNKRNPKIARKHSSNPNKVRLERNHLPRAGVNNSDAGARYRCYASSFHFQILHQKSDPDRKIRPCFLFSFFIFLPCSSFSRMEILLEHPLQMSMETETVVARLKASGLLQTKGLIGGKWTNAYDGWSMEKLYSFMIPGNSSSDQDINFSTHGIFRSNKSLN
ncbi:hypothetical protein R6Q59_031321 [Mikania micrantha]